jgi:DNA-binding MarR family transcriptional regulator
MLRPYDLSPQQLNVLRILRGQRNKSVSIKLIQERMLDKMSNASRLVDKLNDKGLVQRIQSEIDRRQVKVSLTKEGNKLLTKIDKLLEQFESQFDSISDDEAKQLNDLLDKLRD